MGGRRVEQTFAIVDEGEFLILLDLDGSLMFYHLCVHSLSWLLFLFIELDRDWSYYIFISIFISI